MQPLTAAIAYKGKNRERGREMWIIFLLGVHVRRGTNGFGWLRLSELAMSAA